MNKKEFKELDREQMIIAFNQLKDDYSSLFDELEQEKEKNKEFHKFIMLTGGKDIKDFSATEYMRIRQEGYIDGRCYEQQKAEETIMNNYISKDKIREIVNECLEKKKDVITDKEEYCFNVNDNSFLAHRIVELLEEE